jgi:hypothetical protein
MIRINAKVSKQERLTARPVAASIWFHRYKDGVDLIQCLGVVALQDPTLLGGIILVENAEVERLLLIRSPPTPGLKRACVLYGVLLIEVVGV